MRGVFVHNGSSGKATFTLPGSLLSIAPGAFDRAHVENFYGPLATADNKAIALGTTLNAYANWNTTSTYVIPNGITHIENAAFKQTNLTTITIPDSVLSIGERAFWDSELYQINIGNGVQEIGNYAFADCNKQRKVYCKAPTPPTLGESVFSNNASDRTIYVPYDNYDSVSYYAEAEGWSEYARYLCGTRSFEY